MSGVMEVDSRMRGELTLRLGQAILLYEGGDATMATIHPVLREGGGPPQILAGSCLTRETLHELLRSVAKTPQQRVLFPPRLLVYEPGSMAWWSPRGRRPIFFKTRDKAFNQAMQGKTAVHPALLFLARPGQLHAFALAESEHPTGETPLYRAPYFNLYDSGAMCSGNVILPRAVSPNDLPIWEKAFYETSFTHNNYHSGKICLHPEGHDGLWESQARRGCKTFPAEWLYPLKTTVEKAVGD